MQEVLLKLEAVQEIDSQIGNILRKKAEFPQRLAGFEQEIKQHTARLEEKKKVFEDLEKSRKQQAGALELNDDRLKRSEAKLEQIKNNQEFQALQKEIESLKKNSSIIQENANKAKAEVDRVQGEMNEIEKKLAEVQEKHSAESAKIGNETSGMDAELAKLQASRNEAIKGIDTRYLAAYDRIRQSKFGIGIVPAVSGSCKGCNMRIPPQIYNELQRGNEMHFCPSCKRILVYKDAVKSAAQSHATA